MTIPNVSHGLINGIPPDVFWRRWFEEVNNAVTGLEASDVAAQIATINAEIAALQSAPAVALPKGTKPAQILARISLGF
jgi:hypothetical protein